MTQSTSPSLSPASAFPAACARGGIVLARHGEPALSRKIRLSSEGYRQWWAKYEEGGLLGGQSPPSSLLELVRDMDVIFASTRRRAIETAEAVVAGKHFVRDPMFVEAPLPPPPLPFKLGPRQWGVVSRATWWFGYSQGQETRREAVLRARDAARRLVAAAEEGSNVLLLAHGFFNHMVGRELTRMGWTRVEGGRLKYPYWSIRRYEHG